MLNVIVRRAVDFHGMGDELALARVLQRKIG